MSLLKKLFNYIFSFKFEGKNIAVCRDKKTDDPVYFFANDGKYSFLDMETSDKIKKLIERPSSNYMYMVEGTKENVYQVTMGRRVDRKVLFNEYVNKTYEFVYTDENGETKSVSFPFIFRADKEFSDEDYKNFYSYALEDITIQLQKFVDCGVDINFILKKYRNQPLSINYYDFQKNETFSEKSSVAGYVISGRSNDVYINTNKLAEYKNEIMRTSGISENRVNSPQRGVLRHEFAHSISGTNGFRTGIKNNVLFVGVNEALTEIAAKALDNNLDDFASSYGQYAYMMQLTLPDRKKALKAYAENNLDGLLGQYADYYHCTTDEIKQFFYRIDYLHHFSREDNQNLYENVLKLTRDTVVALIIKKEMYEQNGNLNAYKSIKWKDYGVNFVDPIMYDSSDPERVLVEHVIPDILTNGYKGGGDLYYGDCYYNKSKLTKKLKEEGIRLDTNDSYYDSSEIDQFFEDVFHGEKHEFDAELDDTNFDNIDKKRLNSLNSFDAKILIARSIGRKTLLDTITSIVKTGRTTSYQDNVISSIILSDAMLDQLILADNKTKQTIFEYIEEYDNLEELYNILEKMDTKLSSKFASVCINNNAMLDALLESYEKSCHFLNGKNVEELFYELKTSNDRDLWELFGLVIRNFETYTKSTKANVMEAFVDLAKNSTYDAKIKMLEKLLDESSLGMITEIIKPAVVQTENVTISDIRAADELLEIILDKGMERLVPGVGVTKQNVNSDYVEVFNRTTKDLVSSLGDSDDNIYGLIIPNRTFNKETGEETKFRTPTLAAELLCVDDSEEAQNFKKDVINKLKGDELFFNSTAMPLTKKLLEICGDKPSKEIDFAE